MEKDPDFLLPKAVLQPGHLPSSSPARVPPRSAFPNHIYTFNQHPFITTDSAIISGKPLSYLPLTQALQHNFPSPYTCQSPLNSPYTFTRKFPPPPSGVPTPSQLPVSFHPDKFRLSHPAPASQALTLAHTQISNQSETSLEPHTADSATRKAHDNPGEQTTALTTPPQLPHREKYVNPLFQKPIKHYLRREPANPFPSQDARKMIGQSKSGMRPFFYSLLNQEKLDFIRKQVQGELILPPLDTSPESQLSSTQQPSLDPSSSTDDSSSDSDTRSSSSYIDSGAESTSSSQTRLASPLKQTGFDSSDHPSAILKKIWMSDYSCSGLWEGERMLYGKWPILDGYYMFYGSRRQLFHIVNKVLPGVMAYSTFIKRTKNITFPHNRTDLCEICCNHVTVIEDKTRFPDKHIWSTDQFQTYETVYAQHRDSAYNQRTVMTAQCDNLRDDEMVLLMDFKENIKVPIEREQVNRSFFNRRQITCLTFLCIFKQKESNKQKHAVTYLSYDTRHNSSFTIHCLRDLTTEPFFQTMTNIHVWSDGGRHFRSLEVLRCLLDNPFPGTSGATINVNYFCPYHGKSEVDTIFGLFAKVLKSVPLDGIRTIDQLCAYLRSACDRFQQRDSKKYTFKMFVQTFFFILSLLVLFPNANKN